MLIIAFCWNKWSVELVFIILWISCLPPFSPSRHYPYRMWPSACLIKATTNNSGKQNSMHDKAPCILILYTTMNKFAILLNCTFFPLFCCCCFKVCERTWLVCYQCKIHFIVRPVTEQNTYEPNSVSWNEMISERGKFPNRRSERFWDELWLFNFVMKLSFTWLTER